MELLTFMIRMGIKNRGKTNVTKERYLDLENWGTHFDDILRFRDRV